MKHFRKKALQLLEDIKGKLKNTLVATEGEPKEVRKKHLLLAVVAISGFLMSAYVLIDSQNKNKKSNTEKAEEKKVIKTIDVDKLVNGVSNENIWIEKSDKKIDELEKQQLESNTTQGKFQEYIKGDKVSKNELAEILKKFEAEIEQKYNDKLNQELEKANQEQPNQLSETSIDSQTFIKKKRKKVGDYFPAGSRVQAIITSGVDAGVGSSAQADPREVLLRITGKVISAGIGEEYTVSPQLMGCTLLSDATGDISSEKVYLKPIVLSCRDKNHYIEVPIKGYISANGKSGIRGDVVSREGDLVLNSFLSGIAGGFGNGISQLSQPSLALTSGGMFETGTQKAKNIATRGLGNGLGNSSAILSEYFIKRAEQYQPVISINEGTEVHLVLKEGFSLREEEDAKKN